MMRAHVAIIGGGLAGLCAARLLREADIEFMLVEARDRLGGRILTANETGRPSDDGFDLGPSWYWPRVQPAIADLIDELKLSSFSQNSEGDVMFERMSREGPQRYAPVAQEQLSFRLVGGTGALVRALSHDLARERLMLGAQVVAMTLLADGDGGVELTVRHGDRTTQQVIADYVIAAVPPRLFETTVTFTPALDEATARRWRTTPTWMAPHAKFFALYDKPFWREAGLSGTAQSMVGPLPEIHDATTASGKPALFGFLGVGADQRAAMGEAALTRACLDQLIRTFGPQAARPRSTLIKDWAADSLTATLLDRSDGSHPVADPAPWVTGLWQRCLVMGGSETSASEPGYLAGAVVAAQQAVAAALTHRSQWRASG